MKGRRRYLYGSLGLLSLLGFVGVLTQERVFLLFLQGMDGHRALLTGLAGGFAVAVIVHALAELYYTVRESWGLVHDPE